MHTTAGSELSVAERAAVHPHGLSAQAFDALFAADRPVIYNFHGSPSAVKQLLFERPRLHRFTVNGYLDLVRWGGLKR